KRIPPSFLSGGANKQRRQIPMPEPNYADILASVEKHFPAHVLEDLDAERKRKNRRTRAAETEEIANNEGTGNTVTPGEDDALDCTPEVRQLAIVTLAVRCNLLLKQNLPLQNRLG